MNRIQNLQKILESQKIDCAIYTLGASMQYLLKDNSLIYPRTGYSKMIKGEGYFSGLNIADLLLVIPADRDPFFICPPHRAFDLEKYGYKIVTSFLSHYPFYFQLHCQGQRLALGADAFDSLSQLFLQFNPNFNIIPGEGLLEDARMIKEPEEIAALKRVAEITDRVMADTLPLLVEGNSPRQIEAYIQKRGEALGATDVSFPAACLFTKPGHPSAAERVGYPRDLPLQGNTGIAFDFGFVLDGYCSDFGRSFYRGQGPKNVVSAYLALQEGQKRMLKEIKPYVHKLSDIDRLIRETVTELGFGPQMLYGDTGICGHQIGIDVHEDPWLLNSEKGLLQPGMVFCAEPKIWLVNECYMRVEDMILITHEGAESLTKFSRDLFVLD